MQLKYHQKTYDLLTQEYIDPQPAIDAFEQYAVPHAFMLRKSYMDDAAIHKMVEQQRESELAWTKLQLYQRPVQFSDENVLKLDELEKKYNAKLPLSVREWFSLDIAPEIMSVHRHGYPPIYIPVEEMKPFSETDLSWSDPSRNDLWYFLHDEYVDQGGEPILFQVGVDDDPPVFARYADEYLELATTFSQFIYRHFWGWHARYNFHFYFHLYEFEPLRPPQLFWIPVSVLRQKLSQVPDNKRLYFYSDDFRILAKHPLTGDIDKTTFRPITEDDSVIAGGSFHANSVDNLLQLMHDLWENDAPVFHMRSHYEEISNIILTMQCEQVRKVLISQQAWMTAKAIADVLGLKIGYVANALKHLVEQKEIEKRIEIDSENKAEDSYRLVQQSKAKGK